MTNEVRLSPRAWRDLERLADFLELKSPRAANRAKATLCTAIRSLDRFADRGTPTGVENVRELIVPFGRYGYVVIYLVEQDAIAVLRIFHALEDR